VTDTDDRPDDLDRTPPAEKPDVPVEQPTSIEVPARQPFLAPTQPIAPAAPFRWPSSAAPETDGAADHGWQMPPAGGAGDGGFGGGLGEPAPSVSPPPAQRPIRHSRNPVDRLTRGLPDPVRVTIDWIVTIVGAIAIVLVVKAYVVNPYRIPSSSMEPTLHCAKYEPGCEARISDRVLANRFIYHLRDPRRGEIIVFETPPLAQVKCGAGGTFVKRLIGLPGETLELRLRNGDGYVYINGKPLKEPYIESDRRGAVQGFGPVKIKPGTYFMMGDNRAQSCDSRMWGTVPRQNLIGKVFATYWPPNRVSLH
jgi:signal peptidase I